MKNKMSYIASYVLRIHLFCKYYRTIIVFGIRAFEYVGTLKCI